MSGTRCPQAVHVLDAGAAWLPPRLIMNLIMAAIAMMGRMKKKTPRTTNSSGNPILRMPIPTI
jgi:hypothetical protein